MSTNEIIIDEEEQQTLTFIRVASPIRDDKGDTYDTNDNVLISCIGCIQPWGSHLVYDNFSIVENSNKGLYTHVAFIIERIEDVLIQEKDYIVDENNIRYMVAFINDFKGYPQQYDLIKVSDSDGV